MNKVVRIKSTGTYKVYLLTDPNGKQYVGKTKGSLEKRWKGGKGYKEQPDLHNAIFHMGWDNFTKEVLFTGLSYKEACVREKLMIAKYHTMAPNGYNRQTGGDFGYSCINDWVKAVAQIDQNTGEILQVFPSANQAEKSTGISHQHIAEVAKGKRKTAGGYIWRYMKEISADERSCGYVQL